MADMSESKNQAPAYINQGILDFVSKILISVMMVCVSLTASNLVQKINPAWKAAFFAAFSFFTALECLFTLKKTKRLMPFSKSWILFHFSQWIAITIILKIALMSLNQSRSFWMEIQLWRVDFFPNFFDMETLGAFIFVLIIWLLSAHFGGLLEEMSLEEAQIKFDIATAAPVEETPPRERLIGGIFGLGFFLIVITAILRVDMRQVLAGRFQENMK